MAFLYQASLGTVTQMIPLLFSFTKPLHPLLVSLFVLKRCIQLSSCLNLAKDRQNAAEDVGLVPNSIIRSAFCVYSTPSTISQAIQYSSHRCVRRV